MYGTRPVAMYDRDNILLRIDLTVADCRAVSKAQGIRDWGAVFCKVNIQQIKGPADTFQDV